MEGHVAAAVTADVVEILCGANDLVGVVTGNRIVGHRLPPMLRDDSRIGQPTPFAVKHRAQDVGLQVVTDLRQRTDESGVSLHIAIRRRTDARSG